MAKAATVIEMPPQYALVDFGLAQRTDEPPPEKKMSPPNCKRKFSSSDLEAQSSPKRSDCNIWSET